MDQLFKLGFTESALVSFDSELKINIFKNEEASNILYAFVLADEEDIADWKVLYIGHTRKSFKNRMYGYQRGNGKGVNNRLHELVKSYVKDQKKVVKIYCFTDALNLVVQDIQLDLAAGLEYSLIDYYADYNAKYKHDALINIAGNKNYKSVNKIEGLEELIRVEKEEEDENYDAPDQLVRFESPKKFSYNLDKKTYWDHPYLNIPAKFAGFFGEHGDTAVLHFYKGGNLEKSIPVSINRNAVKNGSPRFYVNGINGEWFQTWKHQNFEFGANIEVGIIAQNHLSFEY